MPNSGEVINILLLALVKFVDSFVNNLTPSPAGWSRPDKLILFGPFRS